MEWCTSWNGFDPADYTASHWRPAPRAGTQSWRRAVVAPDTHTRSKKRKIPNNIFIRIKFRVVFDVFGSRARCATMNAEEKKTAKKNKNFSFFHFVKHLLWLWAQLLTATRHRCGMVFVCASLFLEILSHGANFPSANIVHRTHCTHHSSRAMPFVKRSVCTRRLWHNARTSRPPRASPLPRNDLNLYGCVCTRDYTKSKDNNSSARCYRAVRSADHHGHCHAI